VASCASSEGKWGGEQGPTRCAKERKGVGGSWAMTVGSRPPGMHGGAGSVRAARQRGGSGTRLGLLGGGVQSRRSRGVGHRHVGLTWKSEEVRRSRLEVVGWLGKKGNGPGPRNNSPFYLFKKNSKGLN
jgi:hypothetical protein